MLKTRFDSRNIVAGMVMAVCICIMLTSCTSMTATEKAYKTWLQDAGESVRSVTTVEEVGIYSGSVVAVMQWEEKDEDEHASPTVDCYVNEIYICTLDSDRYDLIAYTPDKEIKELEDACNDGDITDSDLDSIIEELDAAGYREDYTSMELAYKKWLTQAGEIVKSVATVMDVGVYSDCDIAIMRFTYTDSVAGIPSEVDCYVNDVYVCTLGSSQYNLIAYTPDEEIKEFEDAYNDGDITDEDLDSIIEVLDAAGYRKDYSDDDDGDE